MKVPIANLRAFLHVADLGSFTAAAAVLDVSQPALSRTIRSLEERVGARLLDRHTRRCSLTPAGAELRAIALRITNEIDHGLAGFADFLACRRGLITIAALPSVAVAIFPDVIRKFREAHPDVVIQVRDGPQRPVLDDVIKGAADFAVTIEPPPSHDLRFEPLFLDEFLFVSGRDGRVTAPARVPWASFANQPFIALHTGSSIRRVTDATFDRIGLAVRPSHECSYPDTVIGLVAAGLGTTALPRLTLPMLTGASRSSLAIADLDAPTVSRPIGIVTRSGRSQAPTAARLIALLVAHGKGQDAESTGARRSSPPPAPVAERPPVAATRRVSSRDGGD